MRRAGFFGLPRAAVVAERHTRSGDGVLHRYALACGHEVLRRAGELRVGDRAGCLPCWCVCVGLRLHEGAGLAVAEGVARD